MRNFLQLVASVTLLATQATSSFPGMVAASTEPRAEVGVVSEVKLNVNEVSPVRLVAAPAPNFEAEVVAPLRAAQAERAAREAAEAARRAEEARRAAEEARKAEEARRAAAARAAAAPAPAPAPAPAVIIPGNDVWAALRNCEAGGRYNANTGNGYYGAYQFDIRTWNNFGGYSRADLAPPAVQDEKARQTQAARGWYPWPACARKLGLI